MITNKLEKRLYKMSSQLIHCIPFSCKHFSYIVDKNNILSLGYNNKKTSPLCKKLGYYSNKKDGMHSEIHAILNFQYAVEELRHCKLINIRIGGNGEFSMAKPCPICSEVLLPYNFREIIYSDKNGDFQCMK